MRELNQRFGSPTCQFQCRDIVTADYPRVDLIIVRDVLFHLPTHMAAAVVEKCKAACGLLLTTTYPGETAHQDLESYLDISGWGFRRVNMALPPFNLSQHMLEFVVERQCGHRGFERHLGLYQFAHGPVDSRENG